MEWICPSCGNANKESSPVCRCGFSPFKILGLTPQASADDITRAYRYLKGVWDPDKISADPTSQKKALERTKQIDAAYNALIACFPVQPASPRQPKRWIIISGSIFALCLILVVSYIALSPDSSRKVPTETHVQQEAISSPAPAPDAAAVRESVPVPAQQPRPETVPQVPLGPEITDEQAIDMVKKSKALDRLLPTETYIEKWLELNKETFKTIGWNATRVDDHTFLVSFTVLDGALTRGFYFDVDAVSGKVQNIAQSPDLQKKHGISYSQ